MREKDREEKEKGGYKGKKKIEDTKEEERGEGKNAQETKRYWSEGATIYNFITNRRKRVH